MKVIPRIEECDRTYLVGKKGMASIAQQITSELWGDFMPHHHKIRNRLGREYFSVEVYPDLDYFKKFDPLKQFEKWAAVQVVDHKSLPESMESLIIPKGNYAVFPYVGSSREVFTFYQYIFTEWLTLSGNQLDDRPHFSVMGDKYKNNDPNSEEEIWIPIK